MKKSFVLGMLVGVTLLSQAKSSYADAPLLQVTTRPDCIKDANDPYDIGPVMMRGPFEGQCMNLALHRPAVLLSEDDSTLHVANFFHNGHFWYATLPKKGVDKIIFQIASFKEPYPFIKFDHTQLRFIMKPGVTIKLTAQDKGSTLIDEEVSDFMLVDQIMSPDPAYHFDPKIGFKSAYGNVMRLVDSTDRSNEEVIGKDNIGTVVRQFQLKMTDDEKDAVLVNGTKLANKLGYGDIYHVFSENCTTVIFGVLDSSMTYDRSVRKFKIHFWNILDPIGGPSIHALEKRGIVDEELPTWNEELNISI